MIKDKRHKEPSSNDVKYLGWKLVWLNEMKLATHQAVLNIEMASNILKHEY